MNSFNEVSARLLQSFTSTADQVLHEISQKAEQSQVIIFEMLLLFFFIKALAIILPFKKQLGVKAGKVREDLLGNIEASLNEASMLFAENKPRVPQGKSITSEVSKLEKLSEKVKEVQDMHASFQTEVIDSHIRIFNILNNLGDNNYLMSIEK